MNAKKTIMGKELALVLVLFFVFSCTEKKSEIILKDISIDSKENFKKDSKLSEVIEDFRFVSLENTKNSLIGEINKIRVFNNKIFVLDALTSKSLFIFSNTGSFLYQVGRVGNGPGEFLLPMDFTIDKKNKEIIILDAERKRMHFYSLEGEFIKTKKLDFFGDALEYDNHRDEILFKGAGRGDNLVISTKNGVKKNSFFPFEKRIEAINPGNPIQMLNDSVALFRLYTRDTIYQINNGDISPYRLINFKNEDKSFLKSSKGTVNDLEKINNTLRNYVESKEHIWLSYFTKKPKNSYNTLFINKKNNHKKYYIRKEYVNDIFYDNYFLDIATTVENEFVCIIQPYRVLKAMKKIETKVINKKKTKDLIKNLTKVSNPVLMFATLKDF